MQIFYSKGFCYKDQGHPLYSQNAEDLSLIIFPPALPQLFFPVCGVTIGFLSKPALMLHNIYWPGHYTQIVTVRFL